MIKIEEIEVFGWRGAIRGMRNPMNSWDKSDSDFSQEKPHLGDADLTLAKNLIAGGPVHSKFMRMITVQMDITAPLYWWKEFDTYKVGTCANSCSTMHKIHDRDLTIDDFSNEHMTGTSLSLLEDTIAVINRYRGVFVKTKDKDCWWQMIQLLPTSFNQKRTVQVSYEVLRNMYRWRKDHKQDEWRQFCKVIRLNLPYSELITDDFIADGSGN